MPAKLCDTCHAKGHIKVGKKTNEVREVCITCKGSKVMTCDNCNGTNSRKCNLGHIHNCDCLNGTKSCYRCRGSGETTKYVSNDDLFPAYPDENSSKKCPTCNGKGTVTCE
jgi:DnaJ-class molecular chaperone